jgi:hypothetical protein
MKTFIRSLDDECKNTLSNIINSFCNVAHHNANKDNLDSFSPHSIFECMTLATCSESYAVRDIVVTSSINKINNIIEQLT